MSSVLIVDFVIFQPKAIIMSQKILIVVPASLECGVH